MGEIFPLFKACDDHIARVDKLAAAVMNRAEGRKEGSHPSYL